MLKAHGSLDFRWVGSVLVIESAGVINFEATRERRESFYTLLARRPSPNWCRLDHFTDHNVLATPEAMDAMRRSLMWSKQLGCVQVGSVGGNALVQQAFQRSVEEVPLAYQEFTDLATGVTSLQGYLIARKPSS
ncbi:hypothetical protein DXV75_12305 [Alteromonas aestuariivivens]|uniref:Uncharacterized protein n=1 Tax=Alteromonas aestuariivivens TaxID=1938339 RepID=A0A3D8M5I6_9ALTE|nr:hypothetical protein [Alteromonas aestuariivivens]RDV24850.1 hypothetical protein DXV75_12305 [Alteromonas aestuariivivens]